MEDYYKNVISYSEMYQDNSEELRLVKVMKGVRDCPVMKYGTKKIKMSFYYCSCDPHQKDPICEACAYQCHAGHSLSPRNDYEQSKVKQVCMCGSRCHQLSEGSDENKQNLYTSQCYFHELGFYSKGPNFYENVDNKNVICLFCGIYCLNDEKNWQGSTNYEKKFSDNESYVPVCACPSQSHKDQKQILTYTFQLTEPKQIMMDGFSSTQYLNMLFKTENTFRNLFSSFKNDLHEFENKLKIADFEFDKRMNVSIFYWAVGNFAVMSGNIEQFYYFDPKVTRLFSVELICKLLEKKIPDHAIIFTFISTLLRSFQKLTISPALEPFPKFKIMDYTNLTPFHRLVYAAEIDNNGDFMRLFTDSNSSKELLIIDRYIDCFESLIRLRFDKQEGFMILLSITSLLKKFSKFYLISYDQIVKFSSLIDDMFYYITSFNKKLEKKNSKIDFNQKMTEIKIVTNITKIFIYFSLFYNDTILQAYLNKPEEEEANVAFIHIYNELGKLLTKNLVHLVNYLREELDKLKPVKKSKPEGGKDNAPKDDEDNELELTNIEKDNLNEANENLCRNKIKKILKISQNLISIFMHTDDPYLLTLKRSLNSSLELNVRILSDVFSERDNLFIDYLDEETIMFEEKMCNFFNFVCSFDELVRHLIKLSINFFKRIEDPEYRTPTLPNDNQISIDYQIESPNGRSLTKLIESVKRTIERSNTKLNKNKVQSDLANLPYYLLMTKSTFIFVLTKIFKIENEENKISLELVESVFRILYYFIDNQPDNCILLLTKPILDSLVNIPSQFSDKVLDLMITALRVLLRHKYHLNSCITIKDIAIKLCHKTLKKENMYTCLIRMMKILKMIFSIPTLFKNETLQALRKDVKRISRDYKLFSNYKKYLITLSEYFQFNYRKPDDEKNEANQEFFEHFFKNENLTPTVAFKNYLKFLSLTNKVYDDGALLDQSSFLDKILASKEIITILKIKNLDLQLRTELIRFFRMVNIDLSISKKKMKDYRRVFTRDFDKLVANDTLMSNDEIKVFTFLEHLVKISEVNTDTPGAIDEYDLLIFELQNMEEIIDKTKSKSIIKLCINYFENGLILPLKVYLNKIFSIVMNMTGREFLKIYTMCYHILLMKKYIVKNNFYFAGFTGEGGENIDKDNNKNEDDEGANPFEKKKSVIIMTKLQIKELAEIDKDIAKIIDPSFQALNYMILHEMVTRHFMSLIENPSSAELANYFSEYESYHEEQVGSLKETLESKGLLKGPNSKKIFELVTIYTQQKNDFENSSIKTNLTEIHSDDEVPYRNLLVHFLFFVSTNSSKILKESIYFRESIEIILKLLIADTVDTQKAVEELQAKNESNVDLTYLAELGFKNLLSTIFRLYNPTTLEVGDDYNLTCHIIKIFKFLCEEHNNTFQHIFLRKLNFKVGDIQKIYFYDMMIFTLDKILLLSGWDKIKKKNDREDIDYFYALYSCIVEMLIEIVQGTHKDNLSLILREDSPGKEKEDGVKKGKKVTIGLNLGKTAKFAKNDPVFECGKALPILLNNIKPLLFNDYANMETIYKVRKELVDFLLAYMEEYACPKRIKFLIMTNFHPRLILKSIGIALKTYYIKNFQVEVDPTTGEQAQLLTLNSLQSKVATMKTDELGSRKKSTGFLRNITSKKGKEKQIVKHLKFTEVLYNYFSDLYFSDEDFSSSSEFEFCAQFYNYFKLTVLQYEYDEAVNFWERIKAFSEDELYEFNRRSKNNDVQPEDGKEKPVIDETDFEIYYVIKFFEQVSKFVTIQIENVKEPVLVVYTMTPLLKYLSPNSKVKFLSTVNRDNRYSKLYALMEETIYFKLEVEYNWNSSRNSKFLQKAMQLDYVTIGMIVYLIVVLINLILLAVLRDRGESASGSNQIKPIIQKLSFVLVAVDLFFVIIWCITKLPLNYTIEREKFIEKMKIVGKNEGDITFLNKMYILIDRAIIGRGEINTFVWLFIFVLAAAISDQLLFLYSIALMSVMNLSTTLNNIVLSIVLKKGQLAWTGIFTLICLYFYSAWAFFYVQDRFIDVKHREDGPEMTCETLLYCWLYTTNEGFRWKAGIGKVLQNISFFEKPSHYILNRFLFDFSFFTVICIVLKKVLFGIILDTFRELRIKQFKTDSDITNICFICEIEKDECEKNNKSFKEHCEKEHNIWEYVNYMITLRLKDSQDMNATNSYAKEQLEAKNITWIPIKEESEEKEDEAEE